VLNLDVLCYNRQRLEKSFRLSPLQFTNEKEAAGGSTASLSSCFPKVESGQARATMSKGGGEESPCGAPWLAPESERGDRHQSTEAEIDGVIVDVAAPINASSSARPVSQLLGALSLSHGHADEDPAAVIHGRSISFADGLASLAAGSSSEASPSRSAAGASTTSSCCSPSNKNQNQSWPGFANVYGSPALSCGAGDNWVEATDRAIAEMVRVLFLGERRKQDKRGERKGPEREFFFFSHITCFKKTKKNRETPPRSRAPSSASRRTLTPQETSASRPAGATLSILCLGCSSTRGEKWRGRRRRWRQL